MKKAQLIVLIAAVLMLSCNKKDDFKENIEVFGPPVFANATPAGVKIKEMYTKYNVYFQPEFEEIKYTWNWENRISQTAANVTGLRYTPADLSYVLPVIDSVDSWVFKVFPYEFSKTYMPLNILMTDTMVNKFVSGTTVVPRIYEGFIATNYILVPYVSNRFEAQKTKRLLRDAWLSLFVEKISLRIGIPAEFAAVSMTGYGKASFTNAEDVMTLYALLKKGRTKQTTSSATSAWNKTTVAQDFGDFVAFIVYTPDSEKEAAYAKNAAIRQKVNIIKTYFLERYGVTFPYIPIAS